jgi:hypothetical protein
MYSLMIDCTQYKNSYCMHQAAPRRMFGPALCILEFPSRDPRIATKCMLRCPQPRPANSCPPNRLGHND